MRAAHPRRAHRARRPIAAQAHASLPSSIARAAVPAAFNRRLRCVIFGTSLSKWVVIAALVALLWVARGVLPPFIIAAILAYVLNPLVDELRDQTGAPRRLIAFGVFLVVLVAFGGLLWVAGARLNAELRALEREGPSIIESVVQELTGGA